MAASRAGSPIPREVADELRRVAGRWHQLPLDHALSHVPTVLVVAQALADEVAVLRGRPRRDVPDLGPAVVIDQLTVMVHDLFATLPGTDPARVAAQLSGIRRTL